MGFTCHPRGGPPSLWDICYVAGAAGLVLTIIYYVVLYITFYSVIFYTSTCPGSNRKWTQSLMPFNFVCESLCSLENKKNHLLSIVCLIF